MKKMLVIILFLMAQNIHANEERFIANCMKEYDESVKGLSEVYIKRWQYKELCECKADIYKVELYGKNKLSDIPNRNSFFERLDQKVIDKCYLPISMKYGWEIQNK